MKVTCNDEALFEHTLSINKRTGTACLRLVTEVPSRYLPAQS